MPDIRNLLPFVQAVRCGSFMAAAAQLQVTPPAVSKSIAGLERELGVRLFNRTTRKLHLTNEGKDFYQRIAPLLTEFDNAIAEVSRSPEEPQGVVKVSTTPTFGRHCLMPIIASFFQQYPQVELDISLDEIAPNMIAEGLDISIQHSPGRANSEVSRALCEYPILLVASPSYLNRKGVPSKPEDLAAHECIAIRMSFGKAALHLVRAQTSKKAGTSKRDKGFIHNPHGHLTIAHQTDASLIAALYGAGIVPMSLPVVLPYLQSDRLKVVLPGYRIQHDQFAASNSKIFIRYPHRRHLPAKVGVFVEFLVDHFRSNDKFSETLDIFAA